MVATILVKGMGTLHVYTDRRLAPVNALLLLMPVTGRINVGLPPVVSTFDKLRHAAPWTLALVVPKPPR